MIETGVKAGCSKYIYLDRLLREEPEREKHTKGKTDTSVDLQ